VFTYGRGPNSTEVVTGTFLANKYSNTPAPECKLVGTITVGP
jgi:hypothetical protein